jgi:hypothetical protein
MGRGLCFNGGMIVFYGIESRTGIEMDRSSLKATSVGRSIRYPRLPEEAGRNIGTRSSFVTYGGKIESLIVDKTDFTTML